MPPKRKAAVVAAVKSSPVSTARGDRLNKRQRADDEVLESMEAHDATPEELLLNVQHEEGEMMASGEPVEQVQKPLDGEDDGGATSSSGEKDNEEFIFPDLDKAVDTQVVQEAAPEAAVEAAALEDPAILREEDLNYDEYDLAEECDMIVTCKTCDAVFKTLEKFVHHKQTKCKGRRSAGAPEITSKKKKTGDVPWFFEQYAGEDSGVRKSERKRKPKYPGGGDMAEPIKKRSQPRNPVNMSSKTPVAKALPESQILSIDTPDRMKAPTLPDEVVRISTDIAIKPTVQEKSNTSILRPSSKSGTRRSGIDSDTDSDFDLDTIVSVNVKPSVNEEDDIPVVITPMSEGNLPVLPKKGPGRPPKSTSDSNKMAQYRVMGVEDCDRSPTDLPALGLTKEQLSMVKVMNLMNPVQSGTAEHTGSDTMSDHPSGDLLGSLINVFASTKDGLAVKLMIRRVIKTAAEIAQELADVITASFNTDNTPTVTQDINTGDEGEGDDGIEQVEADDVSASTSSLKLPTNGTDLPSSANIMPQTPVFRQKSDDTPMSVAEHSAADATEATEAADLDQTQEGEEEDHNFDCDPDLHEWLRDDDKYTLMPKSRSRVSRNQMKDRPDCDLLTRRCLRCGTLYSCVKTLLNHMSYQHSDKKAFFPCIYCRNVYSQLKNVSRHVHKTHGKPMVMVEKLRSFMRCQAFIRQINDLDFLNGEKLTEENDPFLQNVRTREAPTDLTRYGSMTDGDMLAKFGRKVQVIGRPPGRPTKSIKSGVLMTCTLCHATLQSTKEMLKHLKDVHDYSLKALNKIRPKLVARTTDVTISERMKSAEKLRSNKHITQTLSVTKPLSAPIRTTTTTALVDQFGRLVTPVKGSASNQMRQILITNPTTVQGSPLKTTTSSQLGEYTYIRRQEPILKLTKCGHCSKIFATDRDMQKHLPECLRTMQAVRAATQQAVQGTQIQIIEAGGREVLVKTADGVKYMEAADADQYVVEQLVDTTPTAVKTSPATSSSGLETLATISTHEANIKSTADGHLSHIPTAVSMSNAAVTSMEQEEIQTVTITMEQLEQLKASGNNIVYMMKTPSGMQRIDDPNGMEVVEISNLQ